MKRGLQSKIAHLLLLDTVVSLSLIEFVRLQGRRWVLEESPSAFRAVDSNATGDTKAVSKRADCFSADAGPVRAAIVDGAGVGSAVTVKDLKGLRALRLCHVEFVPSHSIAGQLGGVKSQGLYAPQR
jgi:hypothetical protein